MNGVDAFGAISDPVRGRVDLNAVLTADTRLADLNGGEGIEKGAIRLNWTLNGDTKSVDVDLSQCATIGDIVRKIEGLDTPDFSLDVDIMPSGLQISLPKDQAGTITISEIGKGTVARQLGLPTNKAFSAGEALTSRDLNPIVSSTTPLSDILGSKASTMLRFAGSDNDILLQARHNGETAINSTTGEPWDLNGITVQFQSASNMMPGGEFAEFDSETKTILVHIHPDNTNVNAIIDTLNRASEEGTIPPFHASLSDLDRAKPDQAGKSIVPLLPGMTLEFGPTSGGSGEDFDAKGLEIVNAGTTHNISFENCKTVGDLLAELNDPTYALYATLNSNGTGIDIRSRSSGSDFCIGENGGRTATQLGVRTAHEGTRLEGLDYGRGVNDYNGPGIAATAKYESVTPNSALVLRAKNEGELWNDYSIQFVPTDDPNGQVLVSMDEEAKTITIAINPGVTTACEVVEAFNTQPGAQQYFELALDDSQGTNTGEGVVHDGFAKTSGGVDGGIDFTITRNDGSVLKIDIRGAETLGDVLRIINEHPANKDGLLTASLAEFGNGIVLDDSSFGNSETRIDRELLSTAAMELGLVAWGEEYRASTTAGTTASLTLPGEQANAALLITAKHGGSYANDVRVQVIEGTPPGFAWDAESQTMQFTIEPGATTANDLIAIFQEQAPPQLRDMFDVQNGVNKDGSVSNGTGILSVTEGTLQGGENSALAGTDPNPQETHSLYNALIRMQVGMEKDDIREIERAAKLLEESVARLTESRSTIGLMQISLENVKEQLVDENLLHEETLNNVLRIDYAEASLNYMAQQMTLQSAMQITSSLFQMSLLNFL